MLKTKPIFAICCFAVSCGFQPAVAEGFPGKGDRVQYADSLPHYNLGNRYLAREWWEKAVEKYNDAINIYPYDADVYANLSVAYRKLGDMQSAEMACRKAVELNPTDWTSLSNLANLLMTQARFPESYEYFKKTLKCSNLPATERTFIESNLDGMKKIMKARGMTLEGKPLETPGENKAIAAKVKPGTAGSTAKKKTAALPAKQAAPPPSNVKRQLAGANESEVDSNAFDQWLGQ